MEDTTWGNQVAATVVCFFYNKKIGGLVDYF